MKRGVSLVLIVLLVLVSNTCLFALAPFHDEDFYLKEVFDYSLNGFQDKKLAIMIPAYGNFSPDLPKQLYNTYAIAKDIFTRTMNVLSLDEESFFALCSSDIKNIRGKSKKNIINERVVRMVFFVVLYRLVNYEYGMPIRPYGIIGNSRGMFSAFIISGALSLEDGINLLVKFLEVGFTSIRAQKFECLEVLGVSDQDIIDFIEIIFPARVFHVAHDPVIPDKKRVSLVVDKSIWKKIKKRIERRFKTGQVTNKGEIVPNHNDLLIKGILPLERFLSQIDMHDPEIRIFSTKTNKGVLETKQDIYDEILYTLVHPIFWDKMVEEAHERGITRFIVLGKKDSDLTEDLPFRGTITERINVGDIYSLRQAKKKVLLHTDMSSELISSNDLIDFLYYIVRNGEMKKLIVDGKSGAGKTTVIETLEQYLVINGYQVVVIESTCFIKGEEYAQLRNTMERLGGKLPHTLKLEDYLDYERFNEFRRKVDAIQKGQLHSQIIGFDNLYDTQTYTNTAKKRYYITPETIILFDGNIFVNEIVNSWFDISLFIELDVADDLDYKRIVQRARDRGVDDPHMEHYYKESVRLVRRPLVQLHKSMNLKRFDFLIDNTEFENPILFLNPRKKPQQFVLRKLISQFRKWQLDTALSKTLQKPSHESSSSPALHKTIFSHIETSS
ncbi:hypothetical protein ACFL1T_00010 [Chlamydiota bacterium]